MRTTTSREVVRRKRWPRKMPIGASGRNSSEILKVGRSSCPVPRKGRILL
jgi:hypothetical protein